MSNYGPSVSLASILHSEPTKNPHEFLTTVRENLMMGRCCLLGTAIDSNAKLRIPSALPANIQSFLEIRNQHGKVVFDGNDQLNARHQLIQKYLKGESKDLAPEIREIVNSTSRAWHYKVTDDCKELNRELIGTSNDREPSFMGAFTESTQYADTLRAVAHDDDIGWTHPGLLLAGEMLAALVGDRRRPEFRVRTVVMFAAEHTIFPHGVLAELTIERLGCGCGLLVPDAFNCGYLWMADNTFSKGLQNALYAARGYVSQLDWNPNGLNFDWRWRLDLGAAITKWPSKPIQAPLHGRSAEAAYACAMIASARGNPDATSISPLDPHIGTTASLETNSNAWRNREFGAIPLSKVGAIKDKTLLGRYESERLARIVVAQNQPDGSLPIDGRYQFVRAENLQEAYSEMIRFPRICNAVNKVILMRAGDELRKHCTPYIPSAIEEPDRKTTSPERESIQEEWTLLKRTEKNFLTASQRWFTQPSENSLSTEESLHSLRSSYRIWVCTESGMGKSMFILRCQMKIAKFGNGFVPIRVGRTTSDKHALSAISSWEKLTAEDLVELTEIGGVIKLAFPPNSKNALSPDDRKAWIEWLLRNGRAVFLLDALDQTDRDMEDLSLFLKRHEACPAIMTGRPEAEHNQNQAFRESPKPWRKVRLAKFDRRRQSWYLGSELAKRLLTENEYLHWHSSREEMRRHQWKDLLESPMSLKLIKDLATGAAMAKLDDFPSRYELYDHAVQHLIDQVPQKIEDKRLFRLIEGDERELLEKIAWAMIRDHDFTNFLAGKYLTALKLEFKHDNLDLFDSIVRINLATFYQIVEHSTGVLAFRHRSFLEFFAGRFLALRSSPEERSAKLAEIHQMPDYQGEHPFDETKMEDRPSNWFETLRFALSAASFENRHELAIRLIELGNPWVVYQSMTRDEAKYTQEVREVTQWLVHRDFSHKFDYHRSMEGLEVPKADRFTSLGLSLDTMLNRTTRDASWLSPLRELVGDAAIFERVSQESPLLERIRELHGSDKSNGTWNFMESFVPISGGTFDISRYESQDSSRRQLEQKVFEIPNFALSDFPVTNELFELFCPTYRRWRDQYSREHDQPAVYVSWFMAQEFCYWLSTLTGVEYRLPTEWEWEWACRWLCGKQSQHCYDNYWWGPTMNDSLCWYVGVYGDGPAKHVQRTRGRQEAIDAFSRAERQHPSWQNIARPGLLDMSGNVFEWCQDWYNIGLVRVLRGGGWFNLGRSYRSGYRHGFDPAYRRRDYGFRLAAVLKSQAVQSSEQV